MIERLKSERLTLAAVILMLFGSYVLDNRAVTIVAAVLLVAGLVFMRKDRLRGGAAAIIAMAVAATLVVILQMLR